MPINIRADLRGLDGLDLRHRNAPSPLPQLPPRRILNNAEKAALKAAVDLGALFLDEAPVTPVIRKVIEISESRPSIVVKKPTTVPVNDTEVTVAVGFNPEVFIVGGVTGAVGVYGSSTREFGVFLSGGPGIWFPNVGVSLGMQLVVIFGPPSNLSGLCLGLGCHVVYGGTWGGILLFAPASQPPAFPLPRFLGFSVSLSTPSRSPFDLTYQVTYTGTRPLVTVGS
jgi:hypothetical protein